MENENLKQEYEKLTEMQKRFIDYYIETANATKACEMAGYKGKNLNRLGSQNLSKLDKFIKVKLEEKDQFGLDASLQDRTKCAELLGKRYGTFIEKKELTGGYTVELVDDVND